MTERCNLHTTPYVTRKWLPAKEWAKPECVGVQPFKSELIINNGILVFWPNQQVDGNYARQTGRQAKTEHEDENHEDTQCVFVRTGNQLT